MYRTHSVPAERDNSRRLPPVMGPTVPQHQWSRLYDALAALLMMPVSGSS